MKSDYMRIPAEMRMYAQFCVWRYEETDAPKPVKVPYSARTGTLCSVDDPSTWSTFDEAVGAIKNSTWYNGIGFVLSENDPYCFIDLDDPYALRANGTPMHSNPQEVLDRQLHIYREFDSYAEQSPSGKGLHIIVKGSVISGRKRGAIELYSNLRYMTMTGNVYRDAPITPHQPLIDQLWQQMGGVNHATRLNGQIDEEQKYPDEEIFNRAASAENADKFMQLYKGEWQGSYQSHSEADQAYINILAFYTQNREQITRMFRASALGQRTKAQRTDYMKWNINLAFDRMLPLVDIDGLRNQVLEAIALSRKEAVKPNSVEAVIPPVVHERSSVYTIPPGLLGKLAMFIYEAAPRQVPEVALVGAIGLMAGIVGRSYNISGTGLNQYVLLLAKTGIGKEAISSGVDKLIAAVVRTVPAVIEFIGPGEIMSQQALIKYMSRTAASFVSITGEFGLMLQQMSDRNAPSNLIGLRRMFLDLYNKSGEGKMLRPMIYSDKEKNTNVVQSPSFTLLGESTPERFYKALSEDMIAEGLLPRFLTIEYDGPRPPLNEAHTTAQASFDVVEQLATLSAHSLMLNSQHKVIHVQTAPESLKLFKGFDKFCDANINSSQDEITRQLWNRAHIKALKLASLVAIGCDPYSPVIASQSADWAISIVVADVRNLLARFDAGEIGQHTTSEMKQLKIASKIIKDWIVRPWSELQSYGGNAQLHNDKIIPYTYLNKKLNGHTEFKNDRQGGTTAIKRTLKTLVERGDLQEMNRSVLQTNYKTTGICYVIAVPLAFGL